MLDPRYNSLFFEKWANFPKNNPQYVIGEIVDIDTETSSGFYYFISTRKVDVHLSVIDELCRFISELVKEILEIDESIYYSVNKKDHKNCLNITIKFPGIYLNCDNKYLKKEINKRGGNKLHKLKEIIGIESEINYLKFVDITGSIRNGRLRGIYFLKDRVHNLVNPETFYDISMELSLIYKNPDSVIKTKVYTVPQTPLGSVDEVEEFSLSKRRKFAEESIQSTELVQLSPLPNQTPNLIPSRAPLEEVNKLEEFSLSKRKRLSDDTLNLDEIRRIRDELFENLQKLDIFLSQMSFDQHKQ